MAIVLVSTASAQLKNRVPDDGTAVALGSMAKLNASGEISVCGDNGGGDEGLFVETNGDVIASQKMHVLDMPDTSKVRHVVVVDTTNGQLRTQTFAKSVIEATIFSYAEMYETDSTTYNPVVSNT